MRANEIGQRSMWKELVSHSPENQIPTASRSSLCCDTETNELATIAPLAATAGTPIPGKVESPQQKSWGMGIEWPGNCGFSSFNSRVICSSIPPEKPIERQRGSHQLNLTVLMAKAWTKSALHSFPHYLNTDRWKFWQIYKDKTFATFFELIGW